MVLILCVSVSVSVIVIVCVCMHALSSIKQIFVSLVDRIFFFGLLNTIGRSIIIEGVSLSFHLPPWYHTCS